MDFKPNCSRLILEQTGTEIGTTNLNILIVMVTFLPTLSYGDLFNIFLCHTFQRSLPKVASNKKSLRAECKRETVQNKSTTMPLPLMIFLPMLYCLQNMGNSQSLGFKCRKRQFSFTVLFSTSDLNYLCEQHHHDFNTDPMQIKYNAQ